jgi:rhodanese-related sulfurtransferase
MYRKTIKPIAAVLLVLLMATSQAACKTGKTQETNLSGTYRTISPDGARSLLQKDSAAVLLDVRTPEEYAAGRIPGSRLLPLDEIKARAGELPADQSVPLIVYCRTGRRSAEAAAILLELGYTEVFDLGGIVNWPYETDR